MNKKFIKLSGKYYKEVDLNLMSKEQLKELIENVREIREHQDSILSPQIWTAPWNPNRIWDTVNPLKPYITYTATNCCGWDVDCMEYKCKKKR